MAKYRLNFLTNQGDASFKVLARCYLTGTVDGTTPINPGGTTFSDSGNNYNAASGFDDGYVGTGSWHGAAGTANQAFWGIVDFGSNDPVVAQLVLVSTSIIARSPKSFSVERYANGAWSTFFTLDNMPAWSANEIRRYTLGIVSGVVRDDAGNPCARTVRVYRRDTGELVSTGVSDAVTGAYLLGAVLAIEHNVVFLDDSGGTLYNDLIVRVTPV